MLSHDKMLQYDWLGPYMSIPLLLLVSFVIDQGDNFA